MEPFNSFQCCQPVEQVVCFTVAERGLLNLAGASQRLRVKAFGLVMIDVIYNGHKERGEPEQTVSEYVTSKLSAGMVRSQES